MSSRTPLSGPKTSCRWTALVMWHSRERIASFLAFPSATLRSKQIRPSEQLADLADDSQVDGIVHVAAASK